jgi:hypothetical protein
MPPVTSAQHTAQHRTAPTAGHAEAPLLSTPTEQQGGPSRNPFKKLREKIAKRRASVPTHSVSPERALEDDRSLVTPAQHVTPASVHRDSAAPSGRFIPFQYGAEAEQHLSPMEMSYQQHYDVMLAKQISHQKSNDMIACAVAEFKNDYLRYQKERDEVGAKTIYNMHMSGASGLEVLDAVTGAQERISAAEPSALKNLKTGDLEADAAKFKEHLEFFNDTVNKFEMNLEQRGDVYLVVKKAVDEARFFVATPDGVNEVVLNAQVKGDPSISKVTELIPFKNLPASAQCALHNKIYLVASRTGYF